MKNGKTNKAVVKHHRTKYVDHSQKFWIGSTILELRELYWVKSLNTLKTVFESAGWLCYLVIVY